ncbi:MAG TPA: prephenate dehydratase [Pyrinomonadaceae bacterium]|nr:prephenate dehydratase [Pyrinomonadaceae bacterium]
MKNVEDNVLNRRGEINAIDSELLELLNRRAEIALWLGAIKTFDDIALCDHNREREVLERLATENRGPLDDQSIANIFQRIIDESLYLQQRTYQKKAKSTAKSKRKLPEKSRVAFLGEPGTFSEEAALTMMGDKCQTVSCPTFEDLFQAIHRGQADYILAPIENSLVGSIHRSFDLLLSSSLHICAEVILPISHFLIGPPGSTIESIRTVESHPAALGQCEMFFAEKHHLVRIEADDTASSVRRAVESGDVSRAAIGSERAAKIYGGKIIRKNIEDHEANYTRFVLLTSDAEFSRHGTKFSLLVRLRHQPGSLHGALRPFVRRGINLLKIESRPIKGNPSEYSFYFDIEVPASESELRGALEEINELAEEVRTLGRYSVTNLTK